MYFEDWHYNCFENVHRHVWRFMIKKYRYRRTERTGEKCNFKLRIFIVVFFFFGMWLTLKITICKMPHREFFFRMKFKRFCRNFFLMLCGCKCLIIPSNLYSFYWEDLFCFVCPFNTYLFCIECNQLNIHAFPRLLTCFWADTIFHWLVFLVVW